jgi:hypothetical protein
MSRVDLLRIAVPETDDQAAQERPNRVRVAEAPIAASNAQPGSCAIASNEVERPGLPLVRVELDASELGIRQVDDRLR